MIRVGVVSFTNAVPLSVGLDRFLPEVEIVHLTPSRIADALGDGTLDIGLVPVAALASHPEWNVLPGLGIASEGPVRSVLLVSRVLPERITRLVLDPASRTSNQLARLWLRHRQGTTPEVISGPSRLAERLELGDATVAIGDQALRWPAKDVTFTSIDLGGAWTEWTGLPFVFAVWAGPRALPELQPAFRRCYEMNAGRLGSLAKALDVPRAALLESYWTESIRYRLGERENQGLMRYLSLGAEAGYFEPVEKGRRYVQSA